MASIAVTSRNVAAFQPRVCARAARGRPLWHTARVGLATLAAAVVAAVAVALAAAWVIAVGLGHAPHREAKPPLAFAAAGSAEARGVGMAAAGPGAANPAHSANPASNPASKSAALAPGRAGKGPRFDAAGKGPRLDAIALDATARGSGPFDLLDPVPMSGFASASAFGTLPPLRERAFVQAQEASFASLAAPPSLQPDTARLQPPRAVAERGAPAALPQLAIATPSPPPRPSSLWQKLFGPKPPRDNPEDVAGADSRTAIYDIEAHTVYLPDGTKLEAHSGLGQMLDDPRYVESKDRGPTPPNVYDLVLREEPFHGVQAIRLNPVDDGRMFGRAGILAHTYMLGPSGQSFGCISFKDYSQFLHAFLRREIDRVIVVAHLDTKTADGGRGSLSDAKARQDNHPQRDAGARREAAL